jgi:hypothetical protein
MGLTYLVILLLFYEKFYITEMVRTYKKKTNLQTWTEENMKTDLEDIISKRMGYNKEARSFHGLQSTLQDRAKNANQGMSTVNHLKPSGNFTYHQV